MRLLLITLDHHRDVALEAARRTLAREIPGLELRVQVAADWTGAPPEAAEACRREIAAADLVMVTQLFLEEQIAPVLPALTARRDACDAMVCLMCAPEVVRLTRMGRLSMAERERGGWSPTALLKRLRGKSSPGSAGERQMRQLRLLPRLLRLVPGTAQDLRAYFLAMQYWLAGSEENLVNLVRMLVGRYGSGPTHARVKAAPPVEYAETGVYHPDLPGAGIAADPSALPGRGKRGSVGLVLMRSYLLAGNTAHYDAVIRALEARGLRAVPVFAAGLDARGAVERFLVGPDGGARVDALVSLTGFSLVGGPAYCDTDGAREMLSRLDVPYLCAQSLEFQTVAEWEADPRGLAPLQATLMVALPELDGATCPMVVGGHVAGEDRGTQPIPERVERLADRVEALVSLRRTPREERRVAVVLFNFPPNAGSAGTAAFLGVYASLLATLRGLRAAGYDVEVPPDEDALRERILGGNAAAFGTVGNVAATIPAAEHVRREPWLREIESVWGPAPGRKNADGSSLFVLGAQFGNVFVGLQPAFGYEGDPMRLLFERGFAPTHAFSAFYRWIRDDFGAHACLHFGTHGALEFMPGKQVGLGAGCWPERLMGALPNVYLYAANNPSEGALAKRRAAATLVSHLTPPLAHAGLYRGLLELRASMDRLRGLDPEAAAERATLTELVQTQAASLDLAQAEPVWQAGDAAPLDALRERLREVERALIPEGLHVLGTPPSAAERIDTLLAMAEVPRPELGVPPLGEMLGSDEAARAAVEALVAGASPEAAASHPAALPLLAELARINRLLAEDHEIPGLLRALDGRFVPPAPGGDLLRNPDVLPTGRNLYGLDPFRVPSRAALAEGRLQAERLLERHRAEHGALPETVAVVLWGTDNLKSEGTPLALALALMGAEPRFDGYGRLCGAALVPLETLGRPRVDVLVTLSGIFRDLLPLQVKLLAEAAWLAASADEPEEWNLVRRHARAAREQGGCDAETAALRVFSNAEGAYGANVNQLVDSSAWGEDEELAEAFVRRKGFAYGRDAGSSTSTAAHGALRLALGTVQAAYQGLESVELGVGDLDQYFDGLGGVAAAAQRERGEAVPAYVGDQTRGEGKVRTLPEQIELEARTRTLNPRWYEGMLRHGYEGVRQIEAHVTNAVGWSATTGAVQPWIYARIGETYVLDPAMRRRIAELNPTASSRMANRLLEAGDRGYWSPDAQTLAALRAAADELEDVLEGIQPEAAA